MILHVSRMKQIVSSAVEIEQEFIRDALPVQLIGMSADEMSRCIEFCADRLLTELKQPKLCHAKNPFQWMTLISLQGKSNFFEKKVGEHAESGAAFKHHHEFDLNADF